MPTLLAQIAPQRSTQYSSLAEDLAPHELRLSPVGRKIGALQPVTLGGQAYLECELRQDLDERDRYELGCLAMTSAFFLSYAEVGGVPGPFLQPIETGFAPALPVEMAMTRRYRGKTNELFTHFLCNFARFSSAFASEPWSNLRAFDPLSGGGTTLFTAPCWGPRPQAWSRATRTSSRPRPLCASSRASSASAKEKQERLRKLGWRWTFELGAAPGRRCVLALGNTQDSAALIAGFKPHLIVADLPYGIQHSRPLIDLLGGGLPVGVALPVGGCLVMAWMQQLQPRGDGQLVSAETSLDVLERSPYEALAHRVDRVIKQRDVLVARRK